MTWLPPHDWHAPIVASIVGAYQRRAPAAYVEIGVDRGHTLAHVAAHLAPHGKPASFVHGVDVTLDNLDPAHDWLRSNLRVSLHEMSSTDFFEWMRADGRLADVVFVDGDHSYEAVKGDIYGALTVLAVGGTIIVHDTFPVAQEFADSHCGNGWAAVDEFVQERVLDIYTIPIFPGLTIMGMGVALRPEL